jgi:hypothetical protein
MRCSEMYRGGAATESLPKNIYGKEENIGAGQEMAIDRVADPGGRRDIADGGAYFSGGGQKGVAGDTKTI